MIVNHSSDRCAIIIKNQLTEIRSIVDTIDMLAVEWDLSPKLTNQINLAIEEVVSNILFYAYDDEKEHLINIEFCIKHNEIIIVVVDDGKSFNPLESAYEVDVSASLEDRAVGGLGIHILNTLADEIVYKREDGKNKVKLVKII